uniref:Small ribosomal subunit protein uS3c n=2 Tax=Glaucocystis TaxID=38258 RepID=A0A3G1IVI7_9EUKA|nr:ribosomal protein S3 [Glaucocystis incrassata]ASQ39846.1 ribosomal protein S3 [Glaucocystis sp. BBH]ASQ40053.1 ribosomal protein S3 [Glaucocystis incrassata]
MGQKINPIGLRIGIGQKHRSCWFANPKQYPTLVEEDYKIRQYFEKNLPNAGVTQIFIRRKANQIELELRTARPGIIVGREGNGLTTLRKALKKLLKNERQIRLNIVEIKQVDSEASLMGEYIVQQLERRVSFRRILRQAISRAKRASVKGIKIQVSGRLNGAEIARTEWQREGRVPLQTLRADIDYSYREAHTIYGVLGVKVWIFKGELLPE